MNDKSYNGWKNWETWNCYLWMTNDENSQSYFEDMAIEVIEDCIENGEEKDSAESKVEKLVSSNFDDNLEQFLESTEATFFHDLLRASLSEVDFAEIASHLVGDLWEELMKEAAE